MKLYYFIFLLLLQYNSFPELPKFAINNSQHITGSGTGSDPYILFDCADVDSIRFLGGDKVYLLNNDIDMAELTPFIPLPSFSGRFLGNGHTIYNLTFTKFAPGTEMIGFFKSLNGVGNDSAGIVRDLTLSNINIAIPPDPETAYIGILCASRNSGEKIFNVHVRDAVITGAASKKPLVDYYVSGMIGIADFTGNTSIFIDSCSVSNLIVSLTNTGASSSTNVGGLLFGNSSAGYCSNSCVKNVFVTIKGTSIVNIGGFVQGGYTLPGISFINCYVYNPDGALRGSKAQGSITAGFCAGSGANTFTSCFAVNKTLEGKSLYGFLYEGGKTNVTNCYYDSTNLSGGKLIVENGRALGKTTVEMKDRETYKDWDFSSVWIIDPAAQNNYPFLKWENITGDIINDR